MFKGMLSWPAEFAARYRERGYWLGVPIADVFEQSVRRHAEYEAVIDGGRRVSYGQLGQMVERLALHFAERGIAGGRPVVFQLPNCLESVVAYFACLKTGAIPIASLPAHRHTEIEHLARFTDACAWLIPPEYRRFNYVTMAQELRDGLPAMREVIVTQATSDPLRVERGGLAKGLPAGMTAFDDLLNDPIERRLAPSSLQRLRPSPDFPAVFQLSGGSTGLPKVIPRTHDDYLYNSYLLASNSGYADARRASQPVALVAVPMMHNFPLAGAVQPGLLTGGKVVLAQEPDAELIFELVERERVTWICAVPAMVVNWLNHPQLGRADLSSLKSLAVGGSRLNPEPARRVLNQIGPVLTQVYGMAEGLCCSTRAGDPEEVIVETQGRPVSEADEWRIVDEDLRDLPAGELGELIARGPYTIRGYYKADEYNRLGFTADGYFRTGDMVRLHPTGNFVVEGRRKDLINRGGEKIGAEEIENLILTLPAVQNAAVVAMPDPVMGERACAYTVLRPGHQLELKQLVSFLEQQRIARFKLPERLEIVESLPLTAVGKISKKELRDDIRRKLEAEGIGQS